MRGEHAVTITFQPGVLTPEQTNGFMTEAGRVALDQGSGSSNFVFWEDGDVRMPLGLQRACYGIVRAGAPAVLFDAEADGNIVGMLHGSDCGVTLGLAALSYATRPTARVASGQCQRLQAGGVFSLLVLEDLLAPLEKEAHRG